MAIDTAQKRADSICYGQVYVLPGLIPSGGIDTAGERKSTLWGYSGSLVTVPLRALQQYIAAANVAVFVSINSMSLYTAKITANNFTAKTVTE